MGRDSQGGRCGGEEAMLAQLSAGHANRRSLKRAAIQVLSTCVIDNLGWSQRLSNVKTYALDPVKE
jgi:hypothetical protein